MPAWVSPVAITIFGALVTAIFRTIASGFRFIVADRKQIHDKLDALQNGHSAMTAGLATLNKKVDIIERKVQPIWEQVQSRLARILHHPTEENAEMDSLLEGLENLDITRDGRVRLNRLLEERSTDPTVREEERDAAELMIKAMRLVVGARSDS